MGIPLTGVPTIYCGFSNELPIRPGVQAMTEAL